MPLTGCSPVDAPLPPEMAKKAENIGVQKTRMNTWSLLVLAMLAGAFIGFGAMFATITMTGSDGVLPYGIARLISGIVFSTGLILVIVGGAELFTGNNLMVMAWASGRLRTTEVLRAWGIVYLGNFIGSVATAALVFLTDDYGHDNGKTGVTALVIAASKTNLEFISALVHGVLGNVLVCLAVWLSYSARTTADKILVIIPPISAFVAAGFEHSIANMYFIPQGLFIKYGAPASFWAIAGLDPASFPTISLSGLMTNLIPVTIGNMIGGGLLVGAVYWFVYLRTARRI